jgi:hypothetical protein
MHVISSEQVLMVCLRLSANFLLTEIPKMEAKTKLSTSHRLVLIPHRFHRFVPGILNNQWEAADTKVLVSIPIDFLLFELE